MLRSLAIGTLALLLVSVGLLSLAMLRSARWYDSFAADLRQHVQIGSSYEDVVTYLDRVLPNRYSYTDNDRTFRTNIPNPRRGWISAERILMQIQLDEQRRVRVVRVDRTYPL